MNTKAIITGALFTAVLVGTSAFAQQDDHRFDFRDNPETTSVETKSVEMKKVSAQSPVVYTDNIVLSGKK